MPRQRRSDRRRPRCRAPARRCPGPGWRSGAGWPRSRAGWSFGARLTWPEDEVGDQAGPAGLVGGTEAAAVVAVEVLVERHQVMPARVGLKRLRIAEHR